MIETLSKDLTQLGHPTQYRNHEMVVQTGSHEFELHGIPLDQPLALHHRAASLSTWELSTNPWASIDCSAIAMLRMLFINSGVAEKLAHVIFRTISAATKPMCSLPLERLEVRPAGGCDFAGKHFRSSADLSAIMQYIECSWLFKRRYSV